MKNTPYIYIYFLLGFIQANYSQTNKTLIIRGSEKDTDILIQQIDYKKEISHDSIYVNEIELFRGKLNQLGFIQHTVESVSRNDSTYNIQINLKHSLKTIQINNPEIISISKALNYPLIKGTDYLEIPFSKFSIFINQLSSYYQNTGYPFVNIKLADIEKANNTLSGNLIIGKNHIRTIDKIILKGYAAFPKSFIKNSFNIAIGEIYNKEKIKEASKISNTLNFVSEIKHPEVLFTKDSTALYLYLKKEKSNYFDGLIGFSNSQEKKGIQLYGNIDLRIKNAFDKGESLELNWLSSQNNSQTLDLTLRTPYIFKTALSLNYKLNIRKQDTTYSSISHVFGTDYNITQKQKVGFIVESIQSNKTSLIEQNGIQDFISFFYGSTYTYRKTNNHPVFDTKFLINSKISQGKREGSEKQYKIANMLIYLIPINTKNNILLKNTTEILFSNDYLENELFRIGGSKSIRGFDEESFITNNFSYLNIDYNYLLNSDSFLSGITDFGYFNNEIQKSTTLVYSFGIGFSQKTKMGQFGIQYFIGNTNKNPFSFNHSKLHFTISQNF